MPGKLRSELVTTPEGVEWRVGRRWLARSFTGALGKRGREIRRSGWEQFAGAPDGDSSGVLIGLYVAVVLILLLLPLILFGIELIVLGWLVAVGLVARVAFRRPWVIVAKTSSQVAGDLVLEWRVSGWGASREAIDRVVEDLAAGREPDFPQAA
jgi:hypothetical protein